MNSQSSSYLPAVDMPSAIPRIKWVNKTNCAGVVTENSRYSTSAAFLHIPKTGGTSFLDMLRAGYSDIERLPVPLFHGWVIHQIYDYLPLVRLTFMIRDPLERVISGYQSRRRSGRPRYNVTWTNEESSLFSIYPTVEEFILGICSEDDYHKSAIQYCLANAMIFKWGYRHHFHSVESIDRYADRMDVVAYSHQGRDFASALIAKGMLVVQYPENFLSAYYAKSHVSPVSSEALVYGLDPKSIGIAQQKLSDEYQIYRRLEKLVSV